MVTKSDYGLGPLYHGTSKDSADAILVGGLLVMGGQPIWLSFFQEEALENAQEKEGIPVVLEVNLPEDWLLERAEAGTYLSWRDIPPEYIKPVAKQEYVQTYGESGNPTTKHVGTLIILGSAEQREAIEALTSRCSEDIPEGTLSALTVSFDMPEAFKREEEPAMYGSAEKTIWLRPEFTEYDFYHELSHFLDDIAGRGIHREAEADRFMWKWGAARKRIINSNPAQPGTCYEDAWRFLIKREEEGFLVHGTVQLYEGTSFQRGVNHAWVEFPTGWVWEPQTGGYFTLKDFEITCPVEEVRYTKEEAAIMVARTGNMGPWSGEERAEYIKR